MQTARQLRNEESRRLNAPTRPRTPLITIKDGTMMVEVNELAWELRHPGNLASWKLALPQ